MIGIINLPKLLFEENVWLLIGLFTLSSPILLYCLKDKIEVTQDELFREKLETERRRLEVEENKIKNTLVKNFLIITNDNFVISNSIANKI